MAAVETKDNQRLQPNPDRAIEGRDHPGYLLTLRGYFARYGEHLSTADSPEAAFWATEKDFNRKYSMGDDVLRRFVNYGSFRKAFSEFQRGKKQAYLKVLIFEFTII